MLTLRGLDEIRSHVGKELGLSDWHLVTQEKINRFAELTGDDQWIHIDAERARDAPFGGTIAHGYYTLCLAPRFSYDMFEFDGFAFGVNYGFNRVRFPGPHAGGRKGAYARQARRGRGDSRRRADHHRADLRA
jgi:acyl dehydratase